MMAKRDSLRRAQIRQNLDNRYSLQVPMETYGRSRKPSLQLDSGRWFSQQHVSSLELAKPQW